jgi:O-antigen/teichoic acid export membrane protein
VYLINLKNKLQKSNVIKAGFGYTIGNILIKGINFITLPIFSRILTTNEFGVYNIFLSYEAILFVVIGLALHSSIQSANVEFKGKIDQYVSSVSIIYGINFSVFLIISLLFSTPLCRWLNISENVLLCLVFYSCSTALISYYNSVASLKYEYKKYLMVSLFNSLGNVVLSLLLMFTLFSSEKDVGRVVGVTINGILLVVFILVSFYKKAKPQFNAKYWKFGVRYSLPIVPHGLSQVVLGQSDRIMIRKFVGDSSVGIYSLAGNIQLILNIITTSISTVWTTWFYSNMEKKRYDIIRSRACFVSKGFLGLSIGLMAISPELVLFLGGKNYDTAKYVSIPIIVVSFVIFLYNLVVPCEYYKKKTVYVMAGTMIAAVINVITNYLFIKRYGFYAAAYTTLFSYCIYLFLHIIIAHRLVGFYVLPIKQIVVMITLAFGICAFDLYFVDYIIVRWSFCFVIIGILGLHLYDDNKKGKLN